MIKLHREESFRNSMSLDISSSADSFDDDSFEEEPDELSEPEESSE